MTFNLSDLIILLFVLQTYEYVPALYLHQINDKLTQLTIGISPCPNDTFIFEAIKNSRIDLQGIEYKFVLADVEELNHKAMKGQLDITKISYNAFSRITDQYQLLNSGSALGRNCGPLLISKKESGIEAHSDLIVAIPGLHTTANLLLSIAYPKMTNKRVMVFDQIETSVLNGEVDLGLIIHENRFTYRDKGLHKIRDLGEFWEETTGYPIPLGGIAVKRKIDDPIKRTIDHTIKKSIKYAFAHNSHTKAWVLEHAQEMKPEVIRSHIDLYVNDFSIDLGIEGRKAIQYLYDVMEKMGLKEKNEKNIFIDH
jgi:1,4-dihydroxy-6-naphthoate synthase